LAQEGFPKVMKNYKSTSILLMFFVLSALLLTSCAKSEETTNRNASAPTTAPAASPAATTTTTAHAGDIGVPECDAFLKAYEACVHDKVPAAQRATFDTALTNWRRTWHDQVANPQAKVALVAACKSAHEQTKASVKIYGCTL
jgi:hypothetical protein